MVEQEIRFTIKADTAQGKRALDDFSSTLRKSGDDLERTGHKGDSMGRRMGAGLALVSTAAVGAGIALTGFAVSATKMAMDAVESENLFSVALGGMAAEARAFSKDLRRELGLNDIEVRKNTATLFAMFDSMKLGKDAALQMSTGLTKLAYDMASFYNLNPEEAFLKLRSGIVGEAEPLKQLGILVDETTVKTYAYQQGIAKLGEELTNQQKVQARYGVILEQTKNAQGDLARTIDSPTNALRVFWTNVKLLTTELGQAFLPAFGSVINLFRLGVGQFQLSGDTLRWLAGVIALPVQAFFKLMSIAQQTAGIFANFLQSMAGYAGRWIAVWKTADVEFTSTWSDWLDTAQTVGRAILSAVEWVVRKSVEVWERDGPYLVATVAWVFRTVGEVFDSSIRLIKGYWDFFSGVFRGDWNLMWGGLTQVVTTVLANVLSVFQGTFDRIFGFFLSVKSELPGFAQEWFTSFETAGNAIKDGLGSALDYLAPKTEDHKEAVKGVTQEQGFWEEQSKKLSEAIEGIGRESGPAEAAIEGLTEGAAAGADKFAGLSEEMKKFHAQTNDLLDPSAELLQKLEVLSLEGRDFKEALFLLGGDAVKARDALKALGKEVPPVIDSLANGEESAEIWKKVSAALAETSPFMEQLGRDAKVTGESISGLTDKQVALFESLNELRFGPTELAKEIEYLSGAGASNAEIVALMGGKLTAMKEAAAELGIALPEPVQKMIDLAEATEKAKKKGEEWGDTWEKQISTIVTDFSKGVADIILEGKGLGETLKGIFSEFAKGIVRTMIEQLFSPLKSIFAGIGSLLGGLIQKGIGALGGLLGLGGGGGGLSSLAGGFLPGLGGLGGLKQLFLGGPSSGIAMTGGVVPIDPTGALGLPGVTGALPGGTASSGGIFGSITSGLKGFASLFTSLSTAIPVIGGITAGVIALWKLLSKSPSEKFSKEFQRDFAGLKVSEGQIKGFFQTIGIGEKTWQNFRKAFSVSPLFIQNVAVPAAQASGSLEQYLQSLEAVETAWGTFNIRAQVEEALATDNWEALNAVFKEIFGNSDQFIAAIGGLEKVFAKTDPIVLRLSHSTDLLAEENADLLARAKELLVQFPQMGDAVGAVEPRILDYEAALAELREQYIGGVFDSEEFRVKLEELGEAYTQAGAAANGLSVGDQRLLDSARELIDYTDDVVEILQDMSEEGFTAAEMARYMAADIDLATRVAEAFGLELPELVTGLGDLAEVFLNADQAQLQMFDSLIELRGVPAQVAEDVEFLRKAGASNEEIMILMGSAISRAADVAGQLGLEIPPIVQEMIEWSTATENQVDATEDLVEATEQLSASYQRGAEDWKRLVDQGAEFSDRVRGFADAMLADGVPAADAQRIAWELMGDEAIRIREDMTGLGLEVPPLIQMMIEWATANGYLNETLEDTGDALTEIPPAAEEAAVALTRAQQAFLAGEEAWRDLAESGELFTEQVKGFAGAMIEDGVPAADAQRIAWEVLGGEALGLRDRFVAMGMEVPPLIQMMIDWAEANGLVGDSLVELKTDMDRAFEGGAAAWRDIAESGDLFTEKVKGFADAMIADGIPAAQAQRIAWEVLGGEAIGLRDSFVSMGLEVPPLIQMMIEWATANGLLEESLDGVDGGVDALNQTLSSGVQKWRDLQAAGPELNQALIDLGNELLNTHSVADAQRIAWSLMGDEVVNLAERYQELGLELPEVIRLALEYARANGYLADSFKELADSADASLTQEDKRKAGLEEFLKTLPTFSAEEKLQAQLNAKSSVGLSNLLQKVLPSVGSSAIKLVNEALQEFSFDELLELIYGLKPGDSFSGALNALRAGGVPNEAPPVVPSGEPAPGVSGGGGGSSNGGIMVNFNNEFHFEGSAPDDVQRIVTEAIQLNLSGITEVIAREVSRIQAAKNG